VVSVRATPGRAHAPRRGVVLPYGRAHAQGRAIGDAVAVMLITVGIAVVPVVALLELADYS